MKAKLKLATGWDSVRRLVRCFRSLGISLGWRYWRLQNKCALNPWFALSWAQACERQADEVEADGEALMARQYRAWAKELRGCYTRFMSSPNIICVSGHHPAAGPTNTKDANG